MKLYFNNDNLLLPKDVYIERNSIFIGHVMIDCVIQLLFVRT